MRLATLQSAIVLQHASQVETHLAHEEPWTTFRPLMYCCAEAHGELGIMLTGFGAAANITPT